MRAPDLNLPGGAGGAGAALSGRNALLIQTNMVIVCLVWFWSNPSLGTIQIEHLEHAAEIHRLACPRCVRDGDAEPPE